MIFPAGISGMPHSLVAAPPWRSPPSRSAPTWNTRALVWSISLASNPGAAVAITCDLSIIAGNSTYSREANARREPLGSAEDFAPPHALHRVLELKRVAVATSFDEALTDQIDVVVSQRH